MGQLVQNKNITKLLLLFLSFLFVSCNQNIKETKADKVENTTQKNTTEKPINQVPEAETKPSELITIGENIQGNFIDSNQIIVAKVIKVKEGEGNPVEDGTPDEYEIQFSDTNIKSIPAECCEIRLINEGDLNNDGTDEISLFQAPMNGCTYTMTTYTFSNNTWKTYIKPFLIPTACENISNEDLQKRIFKENNDIYFYDTDLNDENGKLIKKKVIIK